MTVKFELTKVNEDQLDKIKSRYSGKTTKKIRENLTIDIGRADNITELKIVLKEMVKFL